MTEREKNLLLEFLQAWKKWSEGPEPDKHPVFSTSVGLCTNSRYWDYRVLATRTEVTVYMNELVKDALTFDFPDQMLIEHGRTPFNDVMPYGTESRLRYCHLNEKRRAWVDKMIAELEAENES